MFNPQPDPPKETFRFTIDNPDLAGSPEDRSWEGRLLDANAREMGEVLVEHLLPAVRTGETLRLTQRWAFITDGTLPAVLPAVHVTGRLNLVSGRLVLSGFAEDGGQLHIQGWLSVGDVNSLGGELMFNPQPDPPLEAR